MTGNDGKYTNRFMCKVQLIFYQGIELLVLALNVRLIVSTNRQNEM